MNRLPAALFLIDVKKEHIAVSEALKLNIPTFAMVDTNSDPSNIDFPIPANDDATKSISLITSLSQDIAQRRYTPFKSISRNFAGKFGRKLVTE